MACRVGARGLEGLAQLRAVPVDLVAAGEVEPDAVGVRVGADVDDHAISPEPDRTPGTGTPSNALASLKVIMQ